MRVLLIGAVILIANFAFCQRDFKGKLVDAETGAPLPFVNIGVYGKGIGTVSDEEGLFHLSMDPSNYYITDSIQFSTLGYRTIRRAVRDLKLVYNEYPEIAMQPENIMLNEVVVTNRGTYELSAIVGYQNYGERSFGYWKDNIALGGELATKIRVKKGLRKLNTLFFEVFDNPSDSVLVRVNLYALGKTKRTTGANLNTSGKNILYTIHRDTRQALVDLSPYDIYVKDDFLVSLELLKVYGDQPIGLVIAASADKGTYSLRKSASLDTWEVLPESAMAYHLNTTYFSNSKRAESKVAKAQRSKQQISGFIFFARRPLSNVKVKNMMSNEETYSNEKGRYQILGEKNDILIFEAQGYEKMTIQLLEKKSININLRRD